MLHEYLEVKTTAGSPDQAQRLATLAVESRLAACAHVSGPIDSTYRWEGSVHRSAEWICAMKTTRARLDALAALIRREHSYENPEIIFTAICGGSPDYLEWIAEQTS